MQVLTKYLLLATATAATVAVAQSTSGCAAQPQFDTCMLTMGDAVKACGTQDWQCLCTTNKQLLTQCYTLCPNDSGKSSQESKITSYCVSAHGDPSYSEAAAREKLTATTPPAGTRTPGSTPVVSPAANPSSSASGSNSESSASGTKSMAATNTTSTLPKILVVRTCCPQQASSLPLLLRSWASPCKTLRLWLCQLWTWIL